MKRCIIDLPKLRISKPGFDVDTAAAKDLLFHESFLFTQPYHFTFVSCPFAGFVGAGVQNQTVSVAIPNVTSDPIVLMFMVSSASMNVFPGLRTQGAGSSETGFATESWAVSHVVISSTRIDVNFSKGLNTLYSPIGAYMMLMRKM